MKIAFCDDEPTLLELYKSEVEYFFPSQEIFTFSNGLDAINYCKENKVDLLFTDGKMPKMDGLELAKNLKALADPPKTVLITGYAGDYEVSKLEELGLDHVLNKPIDYDELIQFIKEQIEKK